MQALFRHTVLYDGECPLCVGSVERLRQWDSRQRLDFLPNQAASVSERFPSLSPEALEGSLHLVSPEGEVWEGAAALEVLVSLLPNLAWAAWIFRIPFARPLAQRVYPWLAKNRFRLSCQERCIPPSSSDV